MGEEKEVHEDLSTYLARLAALNDAAMSNPHIGSNRVWSALNDEANRANYIRHNAHTVEAELDDWIENFAYNVKFVPSPPRDFREYYTIEDSAIVVGASPSLTDEQLRMLEDYEGTIICVNKSLERMYRLGIVPDWVAMAHTTDEILGHFRNKVVQDNIHKSNVLMSTLNHPSVTDEILSHADLEKVFWYNPSVPDCFAPTVDRMMAGMTKHVVIDTGGNAGIWGLVMAHTMGAKNVGLLGMEHCHDISKVYGWSNAQAATYSFYWAPEDDQIYCLTPMFKSYLVGLMSYINNIDAHTKVYNLTPFGPMYAQRNIVTDEFHGVPYLSPQEFVRVFS